MEKCIYKIILENPSANNIAIFTHGAAIKFLVAHLSESNKSQAYKIPIDNTSRTELFYDEKLKVLNQNITDHLST